MAVYAGWLVTAAVGAYSALKAWEAIKQAYLFLRFNGFGYSPVSSFSIILLGLAWFVLALYSEYYYRQSSDMRQLLKRLVRLLAIELAVLIVALLALALTAG